MRILRHNQQKSGSHDTVKLTRWGVFDGSQNTGFIKFELGNEARASFLGPFGQKGELKALRHPRCKKRVIESDRVSILFFLFQKQRGKRERKEMFRQKKLKKELKKQR